MTSIHNKELIHANDSCYMSDANIYLCLQYIRMLWWMCVTATLEYTIHACAARTISMRCESFVCINSLLWILGIYFCLSYLNLLDLFECISFLYVCVCSILFQVQGWFLVISCFYLWHFFKLISLSNKITRMSVSYRITIRVLFYWFFSLFRIIWLISQFHYAYETLKYKLCCHILLF